MRRLRVGQGFDVHAFAEGRRLIIGGVDIPFEKGLIGHSDADVLLHAVADALLGAAGLPDIGTHFPPSEERYRDMDSRRLLAQVWEMVRAEGFDEVCNVDAVVIAERPVLKPHIPAMREQVAAVLGVGPERVNVKATTTEGLGFAGRKEGIAALAVCLIAGNE